MIAHFLFLIVTLIIAILEVAWRISIANNSGSVVSIFRGSSALQIILLAEISVKLTYSSIKSPSPGLTRFSTVKEIGFLLSGNGLGLAGQIVAFEVIGFSDTPLGRALGFLQVYMYIIDAAMCCIRSDPRAHNLDAKGSSGASRTKPRSTSSFTGLGFVDRGDLTRPFSEDLEYEAPPRLSHPGQTKLTSWKEQMTAEESAMSSPPGQSFAAQEKSKRNEDSFPTNRHNTPVTPEASRFGEESKGLTFDSSSHLPEVSERPPIYSTGAITSPQSLREKKIPPLRSHTVISLPSSRVSVDKPPHTVQMAHRVRALHHMYMESAYDKAGSNFILDNEEPYTDQYSTLTSQKPTLSALFSAYFPGKTSANTTTSHITNPKVFNPSSEVQYPALTSQRSIFPMQIHDDVDLSSMFPAPPPRTHLPSTPKPVGKSPTRLLNNPAALRRKKSHATPLHSFSDPTEPPRRSEAWSPSWLGVDIDNFPTVEDESRAGWTQSMTSSFLEQFGSDSILHASKSSSSFSPTHFLSDLSEISRDQSLTAASLASFERFISRDSSSAFWNFTTHLPSLENDQTSTNTSVLFSLEASKAGQPKQKEDHDHRGEPSALSLKEPSPLGMNSRDEVQKTISGVGSPAKTQQSEPFGKEINVTSFIGSLISNDVDSKQMAQSGGYISRSLTSQDLGRSFYEIAPEEAGIIKEEDLESNQPLQSAPLEPQSTIHGVPDFNTNTLTSEATRKSTASPLMRKNAMERTESDCLSSKHTRLSNAQSDMDLLVGDVQFVDEKFSSAVGQIVGLKASNDPVGRLQEMSQMSQPRQGMTAQSTADILESRGSWSNLEADEMPIVFDLQTHTEHDLSPIFSSFHTQPSSVSHMNPSYSETMMRNYSYSPGYPFEQPRPAPQPPTT